MNLANGDIISLLTAAVALAALVRPEISGALAKWRNVIDVRFVARIEIGFSGLGPTLGVVQTLRALPNPQFIDSMNITIVRVSDNKTHKFEWGIFRSNELFASPQQMQLAAGFLLSPSEARLMNVQFHDVVIREKMDAIVATIQEAWCTFFDEDIYPIKDNSVFFDKWSAFRGANEKLVGDCYNSLNNIFYWDEGEYRVEYEICTSRPKKCFKYVTRFCITSADSDKIRKNVIPLIWASLGHDAVEFKFSWSRYINGR